MPVTIHTRPDSLPRLSGAFLALSIFALGQTGSSSSDKFTEALSYQSFAEDAWHCKGTTGDQDLITSARKRKLKAISTVEQFGSSDRSRQARADEFLQTQRAMLAMITAWERFLSSSGASKIDSDLAKSDLAAAEKRLPFGVPPP